MYHVSRQSVLSPVVFSTKRQVFVFIFSCVFLWLPSILSAAQVFSESFDACILPEGWEKVDLISPSAPSDACTWMVPSHDDLMLNDTGGSGCFALADSDHCGRTQNRNVDTLLIAHIDCSRLRETALSFKHYPYSEQAGTVFKVEISRDGGNIWTEVWSHEGVANFPGSEEYFDISAEADGQKEVLIRFCYTASEDWWWQLDDVTISGRRTNNLSWLILLLNKEK